jgi:hypothetical protein
VELDRQYSAAEVERMRKLQDVLLKAMAKKINWADAGERSARRCCDCTRSVTRSGIC